MLKLRASGVLMAIGCTFLVACGGDGDDDGAETPALGTCDRRDPDRQCIELHDASRPDLNSQEEACLERGYEWSNDPCPTEELIGCCEYTFGNDFRECFYTGVTIDPVAYCAMLPFDEPGVWTPAE